MLKYRFNIIFQTGGFLICQRDELEKLLESLIKMVGKTNVKMDRLSNRVRQLEMATMEQQITFIAEPRIPEKLKQR
ncbi:hypothetical protein [Bacillus sp. B15-48]|uniref:hypothetical protein n=1 Tax=Bacillus sp. B15-48 TaxID=1548601 RepID=UPI00193F754B|nr:hypothetical protein [Bacillus sp. B15-48]MBM4761501.1 hypothetical protein [Bacillus sp. B15-48]